jgi:citrate synthase
MSTKTGTKGTGLRGIPVADTQISYIDGANGKLVYRGYDISELAQNATYEEVAYLLLHGRLPNSEQLLDFSRDLVEARKLPDPVLSSLQQMPKTSLNMDILQSYSSLLAVFDNNLNDSRESNFGKAQNLIAKFPTIIAAWDRIKRKLPPIEPDSTLSHSANFLYMLKGIKPEVETAKIFDTCLVLQAEHSFNASTFTARVVASTRAHMYASVSAAIGALSGELHGGANASVMRDLLEIGDPSRAEPWVRSQLDQNKRIMGMGHAVYKTTDPRAVILKGLSKKLAEMSGQDKWYKITSLIEETTRKEFKARKGRDIYPNVDLYTPSVYYVMGINPELFTPIFAMSRVTGWAANVIEEKYPEPPAKPMLYRPLAEYTGNYCGPVGCKFVPINQRAHK